MEFLLLPILLVVLLTSVAVHEVAHGWTALALGDRTALDQGRLSLNPVVHLDLFYSLALPVILFLTAGIVFGGGKPVPVNVANLRNPEKDHFWVALAGPVSNLVQALFWFALFAATAPLLTMHPMKYGVNLVGYTVGLACLLNVALAVFNLLPIGPLDGSAVLARWLPRGAREQFELINRNFGWMILLGVILFGGGLLEATVGTTIRWTVEGGLSLSEFLHG